MIFYISIYKIILGLLSIYFIIEKIWRFYKKKQSLFKSFLMVVIWSFVFLFSFFPDITHAISKYLGLGENLNTLIFLGFVVIFLFIFHLLDDIEKLESDISEIVRKEALRGLNNIKK
ncbi:MAG: DUF2304 domain-containing protein [Candidatus Nomurabacteria bacterium]|nr:DUF2304 domain-containing protein [Candidatus Nomurabacteria bacterium]